jgi:hypothetical protein
MRTIVLLSVKERIMKKIPIIILLFLIVSCTREQSENNVYSIEGYFKAYFPDQPILHKRFENTAGKFVFYNCEEAFSNIHYVGVYLILKEKPQDNAFLLYRYIHIAANTWNGKVIKFEQTKHDGNDEIYYVSKTIKNNELIYEVGIVAIKNGIIFQWVVEEYEGMSEAEKIFREKVKYFKVLK